MTNTDLNHNQKTMLETILQLVTNDLYWTVLGYSNWNNSIMCNYMRTGSLKNVTNKYGWLFRFDGISTFVGYLTPNPFLWKLFYFK